MKSPALNVHGLVDPSGRAAVEKLLNTGVVQSVWYAASVESTNTAALEDLQGLLSAGRSHRRLFLTDRQTGGRGRHGRRWHSTIETLTFSLVIDSPRQPDRFNLLSLGIGVAITTALETQYGLETMQLKWPNDVYWRGRKVAGVLLETTATAPDFVVIGVGLNAGPISRSQQAGSDAPIADLSSILGRSVDRYDCLPPLVRALAEAIDQVGDRPDQIVQSFRHRCFLTGRPIRYQQHGRSQHGLCQGISDQGALVVLSGGETRHLRSGEVHAIRPTETA